MATQNKRQKGAEKVALVKGKPTPQPTACFKLPMSLSSAGSVRMISGQRLVTNPSCVHLCLLPLHSCSRISGED